MPFGLIGGTYMPFGGTQRDTDVSTAIGTDISKPWNPFNITDDGAPINSGAAAGSGSRNYQDYWDESNIIDDWAKHIDTYGHNEALAAYEREKEASAEAFQREADYNAKEAEKQRQYEQYLSDTAFQRKVADYVNAGFSPLAALEGSVGAVVPSGQAASASSRAASASAGNRGSNSFGSLLGALVAAIAMVASKGLSSVAKGSSAKAMSKAAKLLRYRR